MHLRVSRLSEIASADGTSLRNESLQGKDSAIHLSKTKWPRQARPLESDWTFWRRKLRAVFSRNGSSTVLRTPLGEWKSSLDVREWPTLMSGIQDSRQAFRRLPDGTYEVFQVESARNSTRSFSVSSIASADTIGTVPFDTVPAEMRVTASKGKKNVRYNGFHRARQVAPHCREEPTSFLDYVAQQPSHVRHLLRECDLSKNATLKLVSLIYSSRSLLCGTDGGLLNGLGTLGYVWGDSEDFGLFLGVQPRTMNSPTTLITVSLQIMAKVGRAEHRRGCSICSSWRGGCAMPMSTARTSRHSA
jgi:hypothetical protein